MAQIMNAGEVRANFSDVVHRVAYGKVRQVVGKRGRELIALVPIEDLRLLEELEDRRDVELADRRYKALLDGRSRTVSLEDLNAELETDAKRKDARRDEWEAGRSSSSRRPRKKSAGSRGGKGSGSSVPSRR